MLARRRYCPFCAADLGALSGECPEVCPECWSGLGVTAAERESLGPNLSWHFGMAPPPDEDNAVPAQPQASTTAARPAEAGREVSVGPADHPAWGPGPPAPGGPGRGHRERQPFPWHYAPYPYPYPYSHPGPGWGQSPTWAPGTAWDRTPLASRGSRAKKLQSADCGTLSETRETFPWTAQQKFSVHFGVDSAIQPALE